MHLPNVWGKGGALFAFSGMDGETNWAHQLVGSTIESGRGIQFHAPGRPLFRFGIRLGDKEWLGDESAAFDCISDEIVGGSIIVSNIKICNLCVIRLEIAFLKKDIIVLRVTSLHLTTDIEVFVECRVDNADCYQIDNTIVYKCGLNYFALGSMNSSAQIDSNIGRSYVGLSEVGKSVKFAFAYDVTSPYIAAMMVQDGLNSGFNDILSSQMNYYTRLPLPNTNIPEIASTYYKAASVMKVNCYSPEGHIPFGWTTPDRWPHKNMWIWDSVFHAIGLRHISQKWAEDAIKSVLACQRKNGFIPHLMTPDGSGDSDITQPPILAWGAWKVYEKFGNKDFLKFVYPGISSMIKYMSEEMDYDENGLSEWENGYASGMDNSPRFDQPVKDAIDLNCFIVNDMKYLALIARELGYPDDDLWEDLASGRANLINELLWDDETQFYYDNDHKNSLIKIKTEAGFTPLFAGICNESRTRSLIKHLTNPSEFWRPFPVSSVSADEPSFSDNMWRGPTWINYNYLIIEGLNKSGYEDLARKLKDITINEITRWYQLDGLLYEYYDSEAVTCPILLHRKDRGGPCARKSSDILETLVCDYCWTASLFIDLLQT